MSEVNEFLWTKWKFEVFAFTHKGEQLFIFVFLKVLFNFDKLIC
jgi:hypothetical protein